MIEIGEKREAEQRRERERERERERGGGGGVGRKTGVKRGRKIRKEGNRKKKGEHWR